MTILDIFTRYDIKPGGIDPMLMAAIDFFGVDSTIFSTDSYKVAHWQQYPDPVDGVFSYFESRAGATHPYTEVFGLQDLLVTYLEGTRIRQVDIEDAEELFNDHFTGPFGTARVFNRAGWEHIVNVHGGKIPLEIKAVPEGLIVPTGNILIGVRTTCDDCRWTGQYLESLLTHVWYASNVATISRSVKFNLLDHLAATGGDPAAVMFMLHDFGYRGAVNDPAAAIGGLGHLVNFLGTDTIPALRVAQRSYGHKGAAGYSVVASEHSVMTSDGDDLIALDRLLDRYPEGILSIVGDSYDIYKFTDALVARRDRIEARNGKVVLRPDSITPTHPSPDGLMVDLAKRIANGFGGTSTDTGHLLFNPSVGLIWGDGIGPDGIDNILSATGQAGFCAANFVFGMGGGLLQKHNRDTQRNAFKAAAMHTDDGWYGIQKRPLDTTKASKAGLLKLVRSGPLGFSTIPADQPGTDVLETVYLNGEVLRRQTLTEVREVAEQSAAEWAERQAA